jgi:hypothetical protein
MNRRMWILVLPVSPRRLAIRRKRVTGDQA